MKLGSWAFLFIFSFATIFLNSCKEQSGGANQMYNSELGFGKPTEMSDDDKYEGSEESYQSSEDDWKYEARELTKDYTTFPSSFAVTNYLNKQLSSPTDPCQNFESTNPNDPKYNPSVRGAQFLMKALFQSCDALNYVIDKNTPDLKGVSAYQAGKVRKRKITNNEAYVNSHIILSNLKKDAKYPADKCVDASTAPPVYGYGSRKLPNKSGEINLMSKGDGVSSNSLAASGIDCSSFISVALATQGLKMTESSGPFRDTTTRGFHSLLNDSKSCLKRTSFNSSSSIMPGDMINVAGSHIVMVDSVGPDPLGIEKYSKNKDCDSINVSDFDFTYLHSGNVNNSYGPSRVHISKHSGGTMWTELRKMARVMCKEKVKGNNSVVKQNSKNMFSVFRHESSNPNCISEKRVKLKNEECVEKCI